VVTASKIRTLGSRFKKVKESLDIQEERGDLKPIPDNWLDFARLLKMRSGGKIIQFNPYDYQKKIVEEFEVNQTNISVKSRQLGLSELVLSYILWKSCLENGATSLVVSMTATDASILAQRLRYMLKNLVDGGYIRVLSDSLLYVKLENSQGDAGEIFFRSGRGNSNPGVGIPSIAYLFMDEISAIADAEESVNYILPAMSMVSHRKIFLVATPRGMEGYYPERLKQIVPDIFNICRQVSNGSLEPFLAFRDEKSKTGVHIVSYQAHPIYGALPPGEFLRQKVAEGMSEAKAKQEYGLDFTSDNTAFYSYQLLENLMTDDIPDNLYGTYIGIDTSGLTGNDCLVVTACRKSIDESGNGKYFLTDMLRLNKGSFQEALRKIKEFIMGFSDLRKISIEGNGHGAIYYDEIRTMGFKIGDEHILKSSTTHANKVGIYDRLRMYADKGTLKIWSGIKYKKQLQKEILSFRIDGTSPINDDIVSSIAYCLVGIADFTQKAVIPYR
jgi:hypothetical protein